LPTPRPPMPRNEAARLRTLRSYDVLDTPPKASLDLLCQFAARMLGAPIALVSLVDEHRQWFKAKVGLDASETPRDLAFCAHAICDDVTMVVEDARLDVRFAENPLVTAAPDIRFYAGVPLTVENGVRLGTLCVIDRVPRRLTPEENEQLRRLAELVVADLKRGVLEKQLAGQLAKTRRAAQVAREHIRRSDQAARLNALGWWEVDLAAGKVHWSRQVRRLHGVGPRYVPTLERAIDFYPPEVRKQVAADVEGALVHGRPFRFELPLIRADGARRWVSVVGEPIRRGGAITGVSGAIQDIHEAKEALLKVERLALTDPMTGLSNRADFNARLAAACRDHARPFALVLVDVDRFKTINDTLGHDAGDAAIVAVARRLGFGVRAGDTLARLGGDEFAVIAPGAADAGTLGALLDRLGTGGGEPWTYAGRTHMLGLSLGAAIAPEHGHTPLDLYKAADLALYAAKQAGRGCWRVHNARGGLAIAA